MSTLEPLLLVLTLVLAGGYAGMILMVWIGVMPAMLRLSPAGYAEAWRAMDAPMARRMPPYKGILLLLNLAAVAVLALGHRAPLAVAEGLSLLFSLAGVAITVLYQIPLNARLQALAESPDEAELTGIRDRTQRGMAPRLVLAIAAFVVLCVGVVLWPVR